MTELAFRVKRLDSFSEQLSVLWAAIRCFPSSLMVRLRVLAGELSQPGSRNPLAVLGASLSDRQMQPDLCCR